MREPFLLSFKGRLLLTFFEAGTDPLGFEPVRMWRTERLGQDAWGPLEAWGDEGEVPWEFKVHDGRVWRTAYKGDHYSLEPGEIETRFYVSDDGLDWQPVSGDDPVVYRGGVSEAAFEFDGEGTLWAVTRNEDGDETGFGSHLASAPAGEESVYREAVAPCISHLAGMVARYRQWGACPRAHLLLHGGHDGTG